MFLSSGKYKRLIVKLIQEEATPEEQQLAKHWLEKSASNRRLYETYKGLLLLTDIEKTSYDTDKAWAAMHKRIQEVKPSVQPAGFKAGHARLVYAAAGIAAMLLIAIGFLTLSKPQVENKQFTSGSSVSIPLMLSDGSSIVLNRKTSIDYPDKFIGSTREISIFGEAFFEISPDRDKPFIVHASGVDIKVVGTSFNVEARPESEFVRVTVNTGKVQVYPTGTRDADIDKSGVMLSAGEMATYSSETGIISRGVNDDLNLLSWKTGTLTFREARLADVLKALENKYETRFICDSPELLNQRLTARFENESLDEVTETLSLIFHARFEKKGSDILVLP